MRFDNPLYQSQPQTRPPKLASVRAIQLMKRLEYLINTVRRNPDAGIFDPESS